MRKKGYITKKGYCRLYHEGRLRMEHCVVWESYNGRIPEGMCIHHKNENKLDNRITNLQLVTPTEHKRLHSNCRYRENLEEKKCKKCGEWKPITREFWYYVQKKWPQPPCKKCIIKFVCERRKVRITEGWKRPNYPRKNKSIQSHD